VDTNTSKVISVRQGGWHGKTPLTATAGNGSFVTTTESGENITIIAGGSSGSDDDFFYSFTDATSKTSSTKTVTIDVTGASVAFTVPLAPAAPSATTIYVSSGIGPGAATAGSDTTGNGTIGNPYKTLAKALSVAASGNQVILRKGIYRNEANLNVSVTNLTIKGYATDISAGPLNPNNWPVIDGSIDISSVTWELVHSGRQEYRTTQTNLVSGTQIGCAILPGTSPYQIPRWEPLQGWREPRKMTRLPAYGNEGTTGPWSWTDSFRHTGTVVADQTEYYLVH
jgi:hypothetical protein